MTKQEIREKVLDMRRSLTSKYIEDESAKIYEHLMDSGLFDGAKQVLSYSDFDNEVKTAMLTGWLMFHGIRLCLPCVYQKEMFAADIKSAVLELSRFGIAQPKYEEASFVLPEELDVVIVPGIAFDRGGRRIGFGCGYYDRFLKRATKAKKIALAYDFQIVDFIPEETHDIPVDIIITPDGRIR